MSEPPSTPDGRDASALDWPARHGLAGALLAELRARARRRRRRLALACALGVIFGGLFWSSPSLPVRREQPPGRLAVTAPERRTLPDGSVVDLRDGTALIVDFSGPLRRVTLTSGEAHFSVAKDSTRPFVVTAAGVDVRAVGTAFSVQITPAAVAVLVTEGRIAVDSPQSAPGSPPAHVDAGHLAVVETALAVAPIPVVTAMPPVGIAERLAWRIPRLEFSATPLGEVIAQLNGHSRVRLSLRDDSLAHLRISGIVRADNADALVRLLVANYEVVADRLAEDEIVLRRR